MKFITSSEKIAVKKAAFLYLIWYNLFKQSRMLMVIDYYPLVRLDRGQRSA